MKLNIRAFVRNFALFFVLGDLMVMGLRPHAIREGFAIELHVIALLFGLAAGLLFSIQRD